MPDITNKEFVGRATQVMLQLCRSRETQYPVLQTQAVIAHLSQFAADLTTVILNRENTVTALAQHLVADLTPADVPPEAMTGLNEAFCKELIRLLSPPADEFTRLRLVRQITHAQISIRMVITNAHLQGLLARRHHD